MCYRKLLTLLFLGSAKLSSSSSSSAVSLFSPILPSVCIAWLRAPKVARGMLCQWKSNATETLISQTVFQWQAGGSILEKVMRLFCSLQHPGSPSGFFQKTQSPSSTQSLLSWPRAYHFSHGDSVLDITYQATRLPSKSTLFRKIKNSGSFSHINDEAIFPHQYRRPVCSLRAYCVWARVCVCLYVCEHVLTEVLIGAGRETSQNWSLCLGLLCHTH